AFRYVLLGELVARRNVLHLTKCWQRLRWREHVIHNEDLRLHYIVEFELLRKVVRVDRSRENHVAVLSDRFWLARLVRNPLVLDRLVVRPLGCDKLSLPGLPGGVRFGTRLLVARERQDVCLPSLRKCGRRLVDERLPIVAGNSKSLMA